MNNTQTQIQTTGNADVASGTLYQFWYSHFCEKGRWILDYLEIPYVTQTVSPGRHMGVMKAVSGQTSTPVFVRGDQVIIGSGRIAEELAPPTGTDRRPPLLPAPGAERDEMLKICARLDEEIGSDHRRAMFHFLFATDPAAIKANFSIEASLSTRVFYALSMPMLQKILRKMDDINAASAERGEAQIRAAMDWIAERAGRDGYLYGDRFSLVDLTAAGLLFPLVNPPELSFALPERSRLAQQAWAQKFADTPVVAREWVSRIFREYR